MNDINCPKQLQDKLIKRFSIRSRSLRDDSLLNVPNTKSGFGEKTFEFAAVRDWNSLPRDIRTITNLSTFKSKLFEFLLQEDHDYLFLKFLIFTILYHDIFSPFLCIYNNFIIYRFYTIYMHMG